MKISSSFCLAILLLTLLECRSHKVEPTDPEPPVQVTDNKPSIPDTVLSYQPKLGNPDQVRQFPFGSLGKPATSLRLVEFTEDNKGLKFRTSFHYDGAGRLSQWTRFNRDSLIFSRHSYRYDESGKVEVLAKQNQEAWNSYINYGYLRNNDLAIGYSSVFEPIVINGALLLRKDEVKSAFFFQKTGTVNSSLSFGADGYLVKEDMVFQTGLGETLRSSRIIKRNPAGNVSFIRTISEQNDQVWFFTYDDKPNPFRTTGDFTLLKDLIPGELAGVSNTNNVMSMEGLGGSALYYIYEYRPDGYPTLMKVFNRGELVSTRRFVYNQ